MGSWERKEEYGVWKLVRVSSLMFLKQNLAPIQQQWKLSMFLSPLPSIEGMIYIAKVET